MVTTYVEVVLCGVFRSVSIFIFSISVGSDRQNLERVVGALLYTPLSRQEWREPAPQVRSVASPADDSQLRSRRRCTQLRLTFDRPSQLSQTSRDALCLLGGLGSRTRCLRLRCPSNCSCSHSSVQHPRTLYSRRCTTALYSAWLNLISHQKWNFRLPALVFEWIFLRLKGVICLCWALENMFLMINLRLTVQFLTAVLFVVTKFATFE